MESHSCIKHKGKGANANPKRKFRLSLCASVLRSRRKPAAYYSRVPAFFADGGLAGFPGTVPDGLDVPEPSFRV
jgi:hypothetical protein